MDTKTFVVEMIKAMAWPVVIGIALKIFAGELLALIREATKLKVGSVEIERSVRAATIELAKAEPLPAPDPTPSGLPTIGSEVIRAELPTPKFTQYNSLINTAQPQLAIWNAWNNIELAMTYIMERDDVHLNYGIGVTREGPLALEHEGYIDQTTMSVIRKLSDIRGQIAHGHGGDLDELTAKEYVDNSAAIVVRLMNSRRGMFKK